jgi:hypothetical protein
MIMIWFSYFNLHLPINSFLNLNYIPSFKYFVLIILIHLYPILPLMIIIQNSIQFNFINCHCCCCIIHLKYIDLFINYYPIRFLILVIYLGLNLINHLLIHHKLFHEISQIFASTAQTLIQIIIWIFLLMFVFSLLNLIIIIALYNFPIYLVSSNLFGFLF